MKIFIVLYTLLNVFLFDIYGQKLENIKVSEIQKKYVFIDTIKTYERVAEKGYKSVEMLKKKWEIVIIRTHN
jgi:hypothetical protein